MGCEGVNSITKKLSSESTFERNTEFMKKFVYTHIIPSHIIVTDAWWAYDCLDTDNNYIYSVHNHGHGDFGYG